MLQLPQSNLTRHVAYTERGIPNHDGIIEPTLASRPKLG